MKIALLTIWHEYNYGAELQAYATIKILKELGHDVEMIDIRLTDQKTFSLKRTVINAILSLSPFHRKFDLFWRKNIPTTRRYNSIHEINRNPPKADILMVGSDQVWNPDITGNLASTFFGDFGSMMVKKISYASSFGSEKWHYPKMTDNIKDLLAGFSWLSCREDSGVKILNEIFKVNAVNVLDPTLLFDNFVELTGEIQENDTLVYYPLSHDPELENYALNLASQLKLTPINNKQVKKIMGKLIWDRIGIEEWVRNIAQSKFVITRSFHGLAFSIIYKRQFAVLASRNGRGDRLISLLDKLGLKDRWFSSVEELHSSRPWDRIIDYNQVDIILNYEREKSILYLRQALT